MATTNGIPTAQETSCGQAALTSLERGFCLHRRATENFLSTNTYERLWQGEEEGRTRDAALRKEMREDTVRTGGPDFYSRFFWPPAVFFSFYLCGGGVDCGVAAGAGVAGTGVAG
jgi:hypothetical protein